MLLSRLQLVLSQRPLGLVFDIDGTLSPIAQSPGEARLYPGVASLLERAREHAHIAIITGRGIDDGAPIVNVEGLTYVGIHGLEWSEGLPATHPVYVVPEALPYREPGTRLLDLVEGHLSELPGVIVQRKQIGGTIHYRYSPHPQAARDAILSILQEPAQQLQMRLSEGKMAVEILAPLAIDKGQALRRFVAQHDLQSVIFAGDDRTDLDAVLAIAQLREEGKKALSIVVQQTDTLPTLLKHADMVVQGVQGMSTLLHEIVDVLS
jgi:trehalose 6-phosphate phosphatase